MVQATAQKNRELYRLLFESSHDPMWMIVKDRFVLVNAAAASLLGYESAEELIHVHPSDISPEFQADGQPSYEKANEVMASAFDQGFQRFEWIHQKRNGELVPVEVTLTRVPYEGQQALFAVWRDISEHKRLERQLSETKELLEQKVIERTERLNNNQKRLKEAQKLAHLGHWELNLVTNELRWSDEIYRIFELDPTHFAATYEAFLDCVHPDDRQRVNLTYLESLRIREPYDLVHRLLMPDGRIKYVREICNTEFNEQGEPLLSIGTLQDITEKENLRLMLEQEEERYHSLVNNIPAIVYRCALDKHWTMQYMSEFTETLTGYPVTDFLDNRVRSYASVIHPDDADFVESAVYDGVHSNGCYYIEYRIIDRRGDLRWVFEKGQVVHTHTGEADCLDGFIMDISERKLIEEKLQDKNELIEAVEALQSRFIHQPDPFHICRELLQDIKKLTGSEYGLVSEVYYTPEGEPYMVAYALSMLAWNPETRKLYEEAQERGFEFHKLDNLFGHVITDREVVLSNEPENDKRSSGLPKGHPPINNFLGIPVFYGEELVGMIGLANREGGFNTEVLEYISPLVSAFGQVVVARQAQEARDLARAKLAELARLDGLLGIPNRRIFDEYLEQQWQQARRDQKALSLIMIDIDHFKLYNDHYGHQQGDECLIKVAEIIGQFIKRPSDMLARYGGEEFVCVLPDTAAEGVMLVAEKIRTQASDEAIVHAASPVADHVTLSLGLATLIPAPETSPQALISLADRALYKAKSDGRNRVVGPENIQRQP